MQCGRSPCEAGEYGNRAARADANAQFGAAANQHVADPTHRVRPIRISVWIAPREVRGSGYRDLALDEFVIGFKVLIGDGPVGAHAVFGIDAKIGWVKTWSKRCPVDRAAAYALAAIVGSQGKWIPAARYSQIVPVKIVGAGLIAYPVSFGIPEGTSLKPHHAETRASQPLQQHAPGGSHADKTVINRLGWFVPPHVPVNALKRAESMALINRGVKGAAERSVQCVPPWPG